MRSDVVKKGVERVPNRSLFKALGYTDEEIDRPLIGVVCAKSDIVPGHQQLDRIADAVKTLPRGEVRSNRKFFLTVYSAFDKLNWLTSNIYTKFISWMKYHSGIHFETNDFKNLKFDEDMEILLPQIIAVFSDEVDDNRYIDKEDFYRKDQQGNCLAKINKG